MITTFEGKRITGILGILPENEYDYDEETKEFANSQTKRLKKIMGFGKRRAAKSTSTTGDFCVFGMRYLLDNEYIKKEDIGGIVVVGLTPDYLLPHVGNIIQGEFELSKDIVCIDVPQGCCGHLMGLLQAFMLLEHIKEKKILVFTGDVLCRKSPEHKEKSGQFGGDAASITIVENDPNSSDISFNMYMDGTQREALMIPAGGYRMPHSNETAILRDTGDGNMRSYDQIWMNGSQVFNFVQREVPILIDELLTYSNKSKEEIDWFLFHQPNKFMLQKLADKMKVPYEKIPMNIVENFGNSSGSTIPINIAFNLGSDLIKNKYKCCLSAFGSGLTWSGAIMELGNLDFCELIISNY